MSRSFTTGSRRRQLDAVLLKYKGVPSMRRGYIREIREALGMSNKQLAKRLALSEPTVSNFQKGEVDGSITLKTLMRVAETLNCEFVYALVPKTSLTQQVEERAWTIAKMHSEQINRTMGLEQQTPLPADHEALTKELAHDLMLHGGTELWDDF